MDSNFQVTIQANIQSLQKSIKEAQATLSQFEVSANKAAGATRNFEQSANRGRMVAFAFGQVVRDAGFFSQSFGLGLLAISNNIPILIDQISLSVKALAPFVGAISLVGSILTAGLTIWAYSSTAVKKYTDAMSDAKGGAMAASMELKSLLKVAQDERNSLAVRQNAIDKLNESYKQYGQELTISNINSKKNIETSKKLSSLMLLEAEAAALAAEAQLLYSKSIAIKNLPAKELAGFWESVSKDMAQAFKVNPRDVAGNVALVMKFFGAPIRESVLGVKKLVDGFGAAKQAVGDVNKTKALESIDSDLKKIGTSSDSVQKKIAQLLLPIGGGAGAEETPMEQLKKSLQAIDLDPTLSQLDKVKAKINAYQSALKALTDDGYKKNKESIDDVIAKLSEYGAKLTLLTQKEEDQKAFNEALLNYKKILSDLSTAKVDISNSFDTKGSQKIKREIEATSDAIIKLQKLSSERPDLSAFGGMQIVIALLSEELKNLAKNFESAINTENAADKLKKFNDAILGILNTGIVDAFSSSFMAIGDAISRGGNIADAAGSALLGSIANIAQQLGELAIGVGISIKAIKLSLKSLNPFVAIAAGIALLTLAGYARNRASAIAGSGGGGSSSSTPSGGAFGGVRPFAKGGIISGDTLGLMGEYPNARSNPEVVAPLDKLTSLISGSLGDIGGNMGGQLTARISGNDLVILLDRASKNRKNYF